MIETTTRVKAERHEALWLKLSALHRDIAVLAVRKPHAGVSDALRITAEGLLSDCAPFLIPRIGRLPVAAGDLLGLAVQLGQALAGLERYELRHSCWDREAACFVWRLTHGVAPVRRLRPEFDALPSAEQSREQSEIYAQLTRRINAITKGLPDEDDEDDDPIAAGEDTPEADPAATYPRLRQLR